MPGMSSRRQNTLHNVCQFRLPLDIIRTLEGAMSAAPKGGKSTTSGAPSLPFSAEDSASRCLLHYAAKYGASPEAIALLL